MIFKNLSYRVSSTHKTYLISEWNLSVFGWVSQDQNVKCTKSHLTKTLESGQMTQMSFVHNTKWPRNLQLGWLEQKFYGNRYKNRVTKWEGQKASFSSPVVNVVRQASQTTICLKMESFLRPHGRYAKWIDSVSRQITTLCVVYWLCLTCLIGVCI
jgi:carbohydrate-selective porin OprB